MTPKPKTPSPSGISRLLAAAGFERSNHDEEGVSHADASTGFRAYGSWQRNVLDLDGPLLPTVVVSHVDEGQHSAEDAWAHHLRTAPEWLTRYAEAIHAAGFDPDLKADGNPRLIVADEPVIPAMIATADTTPCPECNGWGWTESGGCTCGTGPSGHYGMHERHCGLEPCPVGCPFIPPAPSCGCPCGCPAPGQRDDGTPGWCDPCRMNIHPVTAKTED